MLKPRRGLRINVRDPVSDVPPKLQRCPLNRAAEVIAKSLVFKAASGKTRDIEVRAAWAKTRRRQFSVLVGNYVCEVGLGVSASRQ